MRMTAELPESDEARRKLTQPLGGVLYFLMALTAGIALIGLGSLAFGATDTSVLGVGRGPACVDAPLNGISVTGEGPTIMGSGREPATAPAAPCVCACSIRPRASARSRS